MKPTLEEQIEYMRKEVEWEKRRPYHGNEDIATCQAVLATLEAVRDEQKAKAEIT
jgi:hypothetical protein